MRWRTRRPAGLLKDDAHDHSTILRFFPRKIEKKKASTAASSAWIIRPTMSAPHPRPRDSHRRLVFPSHTGFRHKHFTTQLVDFRPSFAKPILLYTKVLALFSTKNHKKQNKTRKKIRHGKTRRHRWESKPILRGDCRTT